MKDNTKKTLLIYLQKAWKYKYSFLASYLAITLAVITNLLVPIYFKNLLDIVSSDNIAREQLVPQIWHIIWIIMLINVIGWIFWRIVDFTTNYFQSHIIADLSNDCFEYLHKHSYGFFINNFGGALLKRVKWFTAAFENVSDRVLWNFMPLIISIIFITFTLGRINLWMGALVFFWVAIFLVCNFVFTKYKLRYDLMRSEAETANTGLLADTIANHSNVKLFNGYAREIINFFQSVDRLRRIRYLSWNIGSAFSSAQGILWIGLQIGMYSFVIYLWRKGLVSTGVFALIQLYILNIFNRVQDFGKNLQRLYENLADAEEMTVIFNTPHEVRDIARAKELIVTEGEIEFKEVDFNYKSTRSILKDFNLRIAPRENVALIGPSGAGKTTIVKILFRMHDIAGGKVLIDGQNIARVAQESLWQNVSLVPQDPILFHRSLMENIRYGRPEASDEQVMEAAKLARCHDFILKTSDGYNTLVGERGIKLSGGERQRVAIARAILKNAPILVLDEATSSLDSKSESLIQEALSELMKDKTVIVIAHRLSTIRKMDRIVVIEKGKITEIGSHQLLLDNPDGTYNKLWELQAGGFNKR